MVVAIMLSVGLDLEVHRLLAVFRRPKLLLAGLGVNHLLVPLAVVGIVTLFDLPPTLAIGVLICAVTPGGPIGVLLAQTARANLAAAISLVVAMNLINTATAPIAIDLLLSVGFSNSLQGTGAFPTLAVVRTIVLLQLLPLAVGLVIRRRRPRLARRIHRPASVIAKGLLGFVIVSLTVTRGHLVLELGWTGVAAIEVCVLLSVGLGLLLTPGGRTDRAALGLITGFRNLSLALLLASAWFPDPRTLLTTMTYGLMMVVTLAAIAVVLGRRSGVDLKLQDGQPAAISQDRQDLQDLDEQDAERGWENGGR
jgi:BASS family bile acid:Na+ symporter